MIKDKLLIEKFHSMVMPEPNTGCWLWNGKIHNGGYGIMFTNGTSYLTHRLSYTIHKGKIQKGLFVCHTCDVRSCVNPDHLFLGSNEDNVADMVRKNRQAKGEHNSKTKLDEHTVRQVMCLYSIGMGSTIISKMFSMSQATIWQIMHGKIWNHITGIPLLRKRVTDQF